MVEAVALPRLWDMAVGVLILEGEINVMILALASYTQSSRLDAWEDDSD